MDGKNVVVHLAVQDPRLHILVVPRDILDNATGTRGNDPVRLAYEHRRLVETAIGRAWQKNDLKEVVEITGPGHNLQLWLAREDFQRDVDN
jgi:hypothetical protein